MTKIENDFRIKYNRSLQDKNEYKRKTTVT
jgi:hypothetical protein